MDFQQDDKRRVFSRDMLLTSSTIKAQDEQGQPSANSTSFHQFSLPFFQTSLNFLLLQPLMLSSALQRDNYVQYVYSILSKRMPPATHFGRIIFTTTKI